MDSPFRHLFDTNYIPTSEDCKLINDFLGTPRLRVQILNHEIETLQLKLDGLLAERQQLIEIIDKHNAILTHIRRLPDDVFREIFHHTLPEPEIAGSMAHTDSPMLLTRICSSWRRIAMSSPRLWTSIHITVPFQSVWHYIRTENQCLTRAEFLSAGRQIHQDRIRGIQEWINRAGVLPLRIVISHFGAPEQVRGRTETSFVTDILEVLLPYAARWRGFACATISPKFAPLFRLPASSFPLLESLSIYARSGEESPALTTILKSSQLTHCSSLKTLRLSCPSGLINDGVPWSRLRHLSLQWISSISVLGLLAQSQLLVTLQLSLLDNTPTTTLPMEGESITLPLLVNLYVSDISNHTSPAVARLRLPALENMRYIHCEDPRRSPDTIESYSIYKTFQVVNNLQSLEINPESLPSGGLIECLKHCPGLRLLYLRPGNFFADNWFTPKDGSDTMSRSIDSRFFRLLSERCADNAPTLCPQLEDLTSIFLLSVTEQVISEFLLARQGLLRHLAVRLVTQGAGAAKAAYKDGDITIEFVPARLHFKLVDAQARHQLHNESWFIAHTD